MIRPIKYLRIYAILAMIVLGMEAAFAGEEKIGSLVFESLKKLDERQKQFNTDVHAIRSERVKAIREKEEVKKRFLISKDGSVEQDESHAQLSYAWAKILHTSVSELKLVENVSYDHLANFSKLRVGLKNGSAGLDKKTVKKIVDNGRGFITSSGNILRSLSEYKDLIVDAKINQALSNAVSTAVMLDAYIDRLEKIEEGNSIQQKVLMEKIDLLTQSLEALYVQSGILLNLFRDQAVVLRTVNELALSDLMIRGLNNGQIKVSSIQDEVLEPLKGVLEEMGGDMELLMRNSGKTTGSGNGSWADRIKELKGGSR